MTASPREREREQENPTKPQQLRSYSRNGDADKNGGDRSRSSSAPVETTCQQCGGKVSRQFVRVFAEDDAEGVFGCPACYGFTAIKRGATRPDNDGTERERRTAAKICEGGGRR